MYSNVRKINKIKKRIQILWQHNLLQEYQIPELAHFLSLTMVQVSEHREVDNRLLVINKTLSKHDYSKSLALLCGHINRHTHLTKMLYYWFNQPERECGCLVGIYKSINQSLG